MSRPRSVGAPEVGDELVNEAHHASRGSRGAFAHAGGEHLAGVGACGQQRMIAEHFGVAVRGALLVLAVDLTDRGVQIDHQRPRAGARSQPPRPRQGARPHSVELAGVTEREGPQERPHRGRRHRLEPQHRAGAARAQHPDVINMGGTGEHRGDHGEDLRARVRRAGAHPPLDQPQQA